MPHYGGGTDKCARCSKTVYVAEKKVGASRVCIFPMKDKISNEFIILVIPFKLF
jgi:hypothetical protein